MTKICSKCGAEKSIEDFYVDRSKKDGHRNECKECTAKRQKPYYENNKSEISKKQKLRHEKNKVRWHSRGTSQNR
jgi:hypothetical protein